MVRHTRRMEPNPKVDIPVALLGDDVTLAADLLLNLANNDIPNTLSDEDRQTVEDVAAWLRRVAKTANSRDAADWETVRATREDRDARSREQAIASRFGVGEATVRASHPEKRIAKRRIA